MYDTIKHICVVTPSETGKKIERPACPLIAVGECGVVDVECDTCGPVTKPHMEEGNRDSAGNNILAPPPCDFSKPFDSNYVTK